MSAAPERKDFAATKQMKQVMGKHFGDLAQGPEEGKKTAWCTSVGPAELLRALGFNVYFPENHGAMLGATRMAMELIPLANAEGFSPDICSYLTSDIGSYLKGETPLQKMGMSGVPKADVLVFNTNQCRDVKDWFQWYARQWNVPCLGIHTPRAVGEVDEPLVQYVADQTEALVEPLEEVAGAKLDIDRLREIIQLSKQCTTLWKQVLETAANVPSPITFFDGTIQMGPAVVMRGTPGGGRLLQSAAGRIGAARRGRRGGGRGREDADLLGRHADLGETEGPLEPVSPAADLRRRLDLLQQLDLRRSRPGRSVCEHGPGLLEHLHLSQRRPERTVH